MERLHEDDLVELALPLGGASISRTPLDCYVLAVEGRTAALEAVDKEAALRLPGRIDNVLLAFRRGESLIALKGSVVPDSTPGDLRFVAPPHEGLRRTRSTRADVRIPIILRKATSVSRISAYSVNMSLSGLLAECDGTLGIDDAVEVGLLPTAEHAPVLPDGVVTFGGVVRRQGHGLVAIEFDRESATRHRAQLSRLVIEGRREARIRAAAGDLAGRRIEI